MLGETACACVCSRQRCRPVGVRYLSAVQVCRHHGSFSWVCLAHGGGSPSTVARKPGEDSKSMAFLF